MVLLVFTLGIIIFSFVYYQVIDFKHKKLFDVEVKKNNDIVIDQILKIQNQKYEKLAMDYSGYDEMIAFIKKPDFKWAALNFDVILQLYNVSYALVYDQNKNLVHSIFDTLISKKPLIIEKKVLDTAFERSSFCHFFQFYNNELVEVFGATVVPTADMMERKTVPQGYLFVTRNWSTKFTKELALVSNFTVEVQPVSSKDTNVIFDIESNYYHPRKMNNFTGERIADVVFSRKNTLLQERKSFAHITLFISIFTVITILVFSFAFRKLVLLPISKISQTLDSDNVNHLKPILNGSGEFAKLAVLMVDFFIQKDILKEVNSELQHKNQEILTQNEMLNQQKEEILTQAENLAQANIEMSAQKDKIEKSHDEVTANINYAHRIQNSLLPHEDELSLFFPQHFVFNQPRDIVSGDFYWVKKFNNSIIFVTTDCTGHGVSGAFMSILGISALNEIVTQLIQSRRENVLANEILNMLRELIMKVLHQTGKSGTTKDGMDAAVCIFNLETLQMQYAGANMPVVILQNDELIELHPDKMPIGIHPKAMNIFTNQTVNLIESALIYTFSDGFSDQFGEKSNKKYLRRNFKNLLTEIHNLSIDSQFDRLKNEFFAWKGSRFQTDDVLVIGIKAIFNRNLIESRKFHNWSSFSILIAEDSESSYLFLDGYLRTTGAKITWVKDGMEVVDTLKDNSNFSLVLMDLQMPKRNGYQAIIEIRKFNKTVPIIVQTAFNVDNEKQRSFEAGATDYILKPYSQSEILSKISNYLK